MRKLVDHVGFGAVLIIAGIARLNKPVNQKNSAYQGDKGDENPPSRLVDVVETTNAKAEAGEEQGEINEANEPLDVDPAVDCAQNRTNDEGEETPPPIFAARRAAIEVDIVVEAHLNGLTERYLILHNV